MSLATYLRYQLSRERVDALHEAGRIIAGLGLSEAWQAGVWAELYDEPDPVALARWWAAEITANRGVTDA